ncbi:MAG: hypothetical protein K2X77_09160, partial [Candidatus Obscuribacterales bacterium]|nr:hypothetical protein [Candidatus Obscuribacterales bacterium]
MQAVSFSSFTTGAPGGGSHSLRGFGAGFMQLVILFVCFSALLSNAGMVVAFSMGFVGRCARLWADGTSAL